MHKKEKCPTTVGPRLHLYVARVKKALRSSIWRSFLIFLTFRISAADGFRLHLILMVARLNRAEASIEVQD